MCADGLLLSLTTGEKRKILLTICSTEGDKLWLTFSGENLGYMIWNDGHGTPLQVQETEVLRVTECKYLGI